MTDADRTRIADAIAAAEARTDGEIHVVIAGESDDYRPVAGLWAAVAALLLAPFLLVFEVPPAELVLTQLAAAVLLGALSQWRPVRVRLVPPGLKRRRAHRTALEMFLAHEIHGTPERTGVLLFLSLAERHAEIVADTRIDGAVADETWTNLVDRLVRRIGDGALPDGLVEAVETAGDILAEHVPRTARTADRLPNGIVEI